MGRASNRKRGGRSGNLQATSLPPSPPAPESERHPRWYKRKRVRALGALIGTLVLTVAEMMEDLRWLLWVAWGVSWITVWEIAKGISKPPKCEPAYFVLGVLVVGVCLYWLNGVLEPQPIAFETQPEGEPVVRMEPEQELVALNDDGVFPLRFVNDSSDIDRASVTIAYFVAQRPASGDISIKRISRETCRLISSRLIRTNEGIPIKVRLGNSILRPYKQAAAAFQPHGASLLGLKVTVEFRRVSDRKDFKLWWAYGCVGRGKRCALLTTERMNSVSVPPEARHEILLLREVLPYVDDDRRWEGLVWTATEHLKVLDGASIFEGCNPERWIFS